MLVPEGRKVIAPQKKGILGCGKRPAKWATTPPKWQVGWSSDFICELTFGLPCIVCVESSEAEARAPSVPTDGDLEATSNTSVAEAAVAPSAPLPTGTLFGIEYHIASTFPELRGGLAEGKRVMFRFNCTNYMAVMRDLSQSMEAAFGATSPEKNGVLPSPIVCPKCTTLFPDSWKVRATIGGGGATCPGCGNDEALLVLLIYRPEDITDADVRALSDYWRSKGEEKKVIEGRLKDALRELKKNPYYFGMQELWLARNFAARQS
jgi:hypothetical protein